MTETTDSLRQDLAEAQEHLAAARRRIEQLEAENEALRRAAAESIPFGEMERRGAAADARHRINLRDSFDAVHIIHRYKPAHENGAPDSTACVHEDARGVQCGAAGYSHPKLLTWDPQRLADHVSTARREYAAWRRLEARHPSFLCALRYASVERRETAFGRTNGIADWNPLEWAAAIAGEAGELANLLKKWRRGEHVLLEDVAREIADVAIYLDLLAFGCGIDLEDAIRRKFNEVSVKRESEVLL